MITNEKPELIQNQKLGYLSTGEGLVKVLGVKANAI